MSDVIKIQANVSGYSGKKCTLLSTFDKKTRVLWVAKLVTFRSERIPGCVVVSTDRDDQHDLLFTREEFSESIEAYFELLGTETNTVSRLDFDATVRRADPKSMIQVDGFDEGGRKLRLAEAVLCEQVAALGSCLLALRQRSVSDMFFMYERLNSIQGRSGARSLLNGGAFTI